jgi:hypothetical protein
LEKKDIPYTKGRSFHSKIGHLLFSELKNPRFLNGKEPGGSGLYSLGYDCWLSHAQFPPPETLVRLVWGAACMHIKIFESSLSNSNVQ